MVNERDKREKKAFRVYYNTLNRNYKKGSRKKREERHTNNTHTSKMADAEAKPVVEFTKVLLSHITTTRFFFLKICLEMLLFFLSSLSRV